MSTDGRTLLVIGVGKLGSRVVEALLIPGAFPHRIVLAGRDDEHLLRYRNLLRQHTQAMGIETTIETRHLDLQHIDDTAATLAALDPDVIFSCVSLQSYWHITQLPAELYRPLATACTGPFLPMHLTLVWKLMQAVQESGVTSIVVNASFPDATHPVLATAGLSPAVGIGNIAITVAGIHVALADRLDVAQSAVEIRAAFHHWVHFVATRGTSIDTLPCHLDITIEGVPLGAASDLDALFAPLSSTHRRLSGSEYQHVTAATAVPILRAMVEGTDLRTHAPGPNGIAGGWPIRIHDRTVEIDLPDSIPYADAVRLNAIGGRLDGIDAIHPDGTVDFTDVNRAAVRDTLGVDAPSMRLHECEDLATELEVAYQRYVSHHLAPEKAALP